MTVFEALYLMISFSTFIVTLLAYIECRNKHKK